MNKAIMNAMGFNEEVKLVEQGKCPFCGIVVLPSTMRDDLSRREFEISGLCQKCQDDMFGGV